MIINVLGINYEVKRDDIPLDKASEYGSVDFNTQEIFINSNVSDERYLETLAHELAHVYIYESGKSDIFDSETEEVVCDIVGKVTLIFKGYQ